MRKGANCRAAIFAANLSDRRPRWAPYSCAGSIALFLLFLTSRTGGKHFEVVAEGPPASVPKYVIVTKAPQIGNLHFPAGAYPFYARDDRGYYYRAPHPVLEHVPGNPLPRKGGVYVLKQNPPVVRPYVYLAGGLTHVGKLKSGTYEFQDDPAPQ